MESEGMVPGQWPAAPIIANENTPIMNATSGPLEQFYVPGRITPTPSPNELRPPQEVGDNVPRAASRSPIRQQLGTGTQANHTLNNAKSTPHLLPSRPVGSVRNMANKFDQGQPPNLTVKTNQDRQRKQITKSPRSPTKGVRLQKRLPSPKKSTQGSFGSSSTSFGSTSTINTTRSQPHEAFKPNQQPYMNSRPLFGEITSDGKWNGNFDINNSQIGNYALPTFAAEQRRSSDGQIALGHGRSQSHQDILQPQSTTALSPPKQQTLSHKRSRSDIPYPPAPSMPNLNGQQVPSMIPTPPDSATRNPPPTSRIPVRNRGQSQGSGGSSSGPQSRSASAMSNHPPNRNRLSKSPTRKAQQASSQNAKQSGLPRSRYQPPPLHEANGQTLSAKIVAPPPKTSPQLRSSRPRQPVSSATTSASRARAAERHPSSTTNRDGRRPSEQWLGKPYDANQEQTKRRIPELDKIDFEARRERIAKAISQNLEETKSLESLRAKSRSRQASLASQEAERQAEGGAEAPSLNSVVEHQAEEVDKDRDSVMPGGWPTPGGLSVDTFNVQPQSEREPEPNTAHTEFEMDESPVLGRPSTQESQGLAIQAEEPTLLTSATYVPTRSPAKSPKPPPISIEKEAPAEPVQSPSVLENVMRMRQRGASNASDAECADDSAPNSAEDSPSDLEERWGLRNGLGNGLESVAGSIKIMLDDGPPGPHRPWQREVQETQQYNQDAYTANGFTDSPIEHQEPFTPRSRQPTPRKEVTRDNTLRAEDFQRMIAFAPPEQIASDPAFAQALEEYQTRGTITPNMLQQMQHHMVDLQRMSANDGSNGFMIQSLLDSILDVQRGQEDEQEDHSKELLQPTQYEMPPVTPDTPPGWEYTEGTAVVYTNSNDASHEDTPEEPVDDEDDFHVKIRKADEAWERQQRGEYLRLDFDEDERPMPPPKDAGYTPRSSTGPNSATFPPPDFTQGLRISTMPLPDVRDLSSPGDASEVTVTDRKESEPLSAPALPMHAPPPPPSAGSSTRLPFGLGDLPQMPATYSERASSELSPRARKQVWAASGSSRPSIDSQRAPGQTPLPGSVSMSSFAESGRQDSMDTDGLARSAKDVSPSPEHKRLLKRRHIVKELIDTEYTYHQDLKIIEDIYKGTAVPDLISPEDKKILFGNCDEIEKFSLHFYDDLRKAVAPIYIPARDKRWMNKRGSYSTTQSNETTQTSNHSDAIDDEKDRSTTVGQAFLDNLSRMEQFYSIYLKNHDAANSRLAALRSTPTVKCWLDECHNNASDITSAWDLDSLLVKPTQRVSKYPMLLMQLLETTPQDHPDREALSTAAKDSVSMLTRINEAKKRADLVDQIVNRKRKDSDVRSGIAKAFGRRTEKLKERVGIAEAFQDPEFDQLAHKFGGHFIRLQICMRDVQDYLNRIEKSMEQVNNFANALDLFTDVSMSMGSEIESKWRKYGQMIRELTTTAFHEHRIGVQKRVITPMIACIKLHDGPQNAINNRKKRIVDYAKCKAIEKRGEKPDKRTVEASEMYLALNDQLKIELPKLYSLTAVLVQDCLMVFVDLQRTWSNTWERKLRPCLEAGDFPEHIAAIEPAFRADYNLVKDLMMDLGICNGAALAESANFLSPTITHGDDQSSSSKRPSTLDSSKRTMSMGSDSSPMPSSAGYKRRSSSYAPGSASAAVTFANDGRMRSSSSLSNRETPTTTPGSGMMANRPWSNVNTPTTPYNLSRPATANAPSSQQAVYLPPRASAEHQRSPRPTSQATYFTARPEIDDLRFSGIFNSAMPPDTPDPTRPTSPRPLPEDTNVLFVCASLFEFAIDKTRKEAGYPYLTYVQGEVFDVIAQKGELWLARNQDDSSSTLGWIWEQHFVILSQD